MKPVSCEDFARSRFALSNFIFMVWKAKVDAAAVNVEALSEILYTHGTTLDMPAWTTTPPRAIPSVFPVFFLVRFPQSKVRNGFTVILICVITLTGAGSSLSLRLPAI